MAEQNEAKLGWAERRRERKRLKRERTGPSPEKLAERSKRDEMSPGENADKAGTFGFFTPLG